MIDFAKKAKISKEADETLNNILSKNYDTLEQYAEISKITDVEVYAMNNITVFQPCQYMR